MAHKHDSSRRRVSFIFSRVSLFIIVTLLKLACFLPLRKEQGHQMGTRATDMFSYWARNLPFKIRTIRVKKGGRVRVKPVSKGPF